MKILQRNKHPHPLIYLKGFQFQDLLAIVDFLYFGEANVYQENLDSFLAIAEELKLEGLTDQTSSEAQKEQEKSVNLEPIQKTKAPFEISATHNNDVQIFSDAENAARVIASPNVVSLQTLDEKVKSMMEKSENLIRAGKQANGTPKRATALICKECGKEGLRADVIEHIEAKHLKGICIPCDYCDKVFSTRAYLRKHKSVFHK